MTTAEALRGDGGPELQRIVRAVVAIERNTPRYWNKAADHEFRTALAEQLNTSRPGNDGRDVSEQDRRKLRAELLRRL